MRALYRGFAPIWRIYNNMKKSVVKIMACALVGTIVFTGLNLDSAATGLSAKLPVEGLALKLEEGTSFEAIKSEVESSKMTTTANDKMESIKDIETVLDVSSNSTETDPKYSFDTEEEETTTQEAETEVETQAATEAATEETVLSDEEKEFSSLVIAKVNKYVNVRDIPSEEGEVVGKLYDKSVGTYLSEKDGWYEINSGNVTGYVKAEYCVTGDEAIALAKEVGERIAVVTTTTLKVRSEASPDATVLGLIPIEDELSVLEELDGWIKVNIEEGDGYVSAEYVSLRTDFVKAESKAEEEKRLKKEEEEREAAKEAIVKATREQQKNQEKEQAKTNTESGTETNKSAPIAVSGGSDAGNSVAGFATQFVGNPYVYGGTSLTNGADCSGFVMSVYQNFGVGLPHSSAALRSKGSTVDGLENAQPGDLVCYSGHVGIYIGGGQIVHASTAKTGIKISNANYRNVLSVRRIF